MDCKDLTEFPWRFVSGHAKAFSNFIGDLREFTYLEAFFWFLFSLLCTFLSFIDLNHWIKPELSYSMWSWETHRDVWGMTIVQRCWMAGSGAASFCGVMGTILLTKGKLSSYLWFYVGVVLYGMYAYHYGYNGDFQLQFFVFLPGIIYGITYWEVRLDEEKTVKSESLGPMQWIGCAVLTVALVAFFMWEIPVVSIKMGGYYGFAYYSLPHWLDAISNTLSTMAQLLMAFSKWEQWIYWICAAVPQIWMWGGAAGFGMDYNLTLLFSIYLTLNIRGFFLWYNRSVAGQKSNIDVEVTEENK